MAFSLTSRPVRFCITATILAIVLFVFEEALFELVLGEGKEQNILIGSLEILGAFVISFLVVRRAVQVAEHHLSVAFDE